MSISLFSQMLRGVLTARISRFHEIFPCLHRRGNGIDIIVYIHQDYYLARVFGFIRVLHDIDYIAGFDRDKNLLKRYMPLSLDLPVFFVIPMEYHFC